jgi:hypothetical protein
VTLPIPLAVRVGGASTPRLDVPRGRLGRPSLLARACGAEDQPARRRPRRRTEGCRDTLAAQSLTVTSMPILSAPCLHTMSPKPSFRP